MEKFPLSTYIVFVRSLQHFVSRERPFTQGILDHCIR